LSRTVGYDVQSGPIWLVGVAVAVVLMVWALREALRAKQTLAAIVVVQVFGLLVSPISWSHHWVWALPALMWLLYGPANRHRLVNATSIVWVLSIGSFLISFLLIWQDSIWTIPRPWWESLLGWVYPAAGLLTLVAIAVGLRALKADPQTSEEISSPESEPLPADRR
jgi:alpha-1,2-mannosyltransferase